MPRPVFDYTAGLPWIANDAVESAVERALEESGPRVAADRYHDAVVGQLRTNPAFRDAFLDVYERAGVNVSSVTLGSSDPALSYVEGARRDFSRWTAMVDSVDRLRKVTAPDHARSVAAAGDELGVLLNTQNLGALTGGDVDEIDRWFDRGVRIMQLTYNRQNAFGSGCTDRSAGGLSNRGLEAVERVNDLGAMLDLSHCGKRTTLDAIEHSEKPVAFTHTCCSAVAEHDRAKSDEELEALADADGYVGILGLGMFLAPGVDSPSIEWLFDHLEHAVDVLGPERVGIGSDFTADHHVTYPEPLLEGSMARAREAGFREEHDPYIGEGANAAMGTFEDWSAIAEGLEERFDERTVDRILGDNFLEFWERAR